MGGGLAWPAALASRLVSQFSAIERQQSILHGGASTLGDVTQQKCPPSPNSFPAQPAPRARHGPTALLSLPHNLRTSYSLFVRPCRSGTSQDGEQPAHPLSRSSLSGGEQRSLPHQSEEPTLPNTEFTSKIGNCLHLRQRMSRFNHKNKIICSLVAVKLTHPLPARSLCLSNKSQP